MKTKLFFLLAALLLGCTSAFAQSGDSEPLKGDVNGDGVVDIADINAVIEIMKNGGGTGGETKYYWYVGTTKPTSLSQCEIVESYPEEQIYTNNSGSKSHIFVLTNSDKTVTFINRQLNAPVDQKEVDITTIPGYKIWETAVGTANGGSIKIRISEETKYYWYLGVDQPTAVNQPSAWRISNQDAGFTVTVDIGEDFTWFAYPSDWTYSAIDSSGDEFSFNAFVNKQTKESIPGYILLKSPKMAGSDTITITFNK